MIRVVATGLDREGRGVGRLEDGRAVFVAGLLPDEVAEIEITLQKKNFAVGRIVNLLETHRQRVEPDCPYFGACGGCALQHATYDLQLELKERILRETMQRLGKVNDAEAITRPVMPSSQTTHYRNKLTLHAGVVENYLTLGMYIANSTKLVRVEQCLLATAPINQVLLDLHQHFFPAVSGKGLSIAAKTVVIRQGSDGKIAVAMTLEHQPLDKSAAKLRALAESLGFALIFLRLDNRPWDGPLLTMTATYENIRLSMPNTSFAQVNPGVAENLYRYVVEALGDIEGQSIADLFCGAGATSIFLARAGAKVTAIESDALAITCAKENASISGAAGIKFIAGLAEQELPRYLKSGKKFAAVVVDPPRAGLARPLTELLASSGIPRIVYVSCDPATLARDTALLQGGGYQVEIIQPFDMFPQTGHVECVVGLRKMD